MKKYSIIYADPPWKFNNKNTGGSMKSGAKSKYKTMTLEELKQFDINSISNDNCVLFMWWVASQPEEAIELVKSWGFKLKTMTGFTWVKLSESKLRTALINKTMKLTKTIIHDGKMLNLILRGLERIKLIDFFGMGFWTRQSSESCLIAIKGKPKRISASVRNVIYAVNEKHSKKPDEARKRIVELMGDLPRVELFAREKADGWDVFGNEVESDVDLGFKSINEEKDNTVLPLAGRSFSSGQKIKVELEDGTVWNAEVSNENTVIIDCTPEYMSYYEWNYGGGNQFPTPIDNEYQFKDVKVLGVL